ncbi:MAG: phosphohistidine swiveling domain-containing protein [Myxococcota bacterium]|jgi:phosphohistidine swiveling domain-containing protein
MPTLLALDAIDLSTTASAGRKAATLGALKRAGFHVPDGRVLDASWFHTWRDDALDRDALLDHVRQALDALGDGPMAVRSSGVAEDGADQSMAGCFHTSLGVHGADQAVAAVLACWASADAARSTLAVDAGGMAALIQRQVVPTAAGVAFTADPVTGERDVVCIEAVRGLADALMAGEADGERWRVRGDDADGSGGVLTEDQARAVAQTARAVAQRLGCPIDMEWALAEGEVAVLQARPITALPAAPVPITEPDPPGAWKRDDHSPNTTPLCFALWYRVYPAQLTSALKECGVPMEGFEARQIRGQVYMRLLTGAPDGPPPPGWVLWLASRLMPSLRRAEHTLRAYIEGGILAVLDDWENETGPALEARARRLLAVDLTALDDASLLAHLEDSRSLMSDAGDMHARLGGGYAIPVGRMLVEAEDWLGWTDSETYELVAGWSVGTTAVDLELAALAAPWADDPRLHEGTLADVRAALPALAARLDGWCGWEGLRRQDYDLAERTLAECPQLLLRGLRDGAANRERLLHTREAARTQAATRLAAAREALSPERTAVFERRVHDARKGAHLRDTNALVTVQVPSSIVRLAALELGRRLTARGALEAPEHTFYVLPEEWSEAIAGRAPDLPAAVARRRGEHSWALANPGPMKLGTHHAEPDPSWFPPHLSMFFRIFSRFDAPEREGDGLLGLAGGGGTTIATARVLRTPADLHRLRPGDVLVCQCTGAAWAPAYGVAGAVVTERGGVLSHPAILAREYGLPAVLGVPGATTRIRDGQRIRVDGTRGSVEVL